MGDVALHGTDFAAMLHGECEMALHGTDCTVLVLHESELLLSNKYLISSAVGSVGMDEGSRDTTSDVVFTGLHGLTGLTHFSDFCSGTGGALRTGIQGAAGFSSVCTKFVRDVKICGWSSDSIRRLSFILS